MPIVTPLLALFVRSYSEKVQFIQLFSTEIGQTRIIQDLLNQETSNIHHRFPTEKLVN